MLFTCGSSASNMLTASAEPVPLHASQCDIASHHEHPCFSFLYCNSENAVLELGTSTLGV